MYIPPKKAFDISPSKQKFEVADKNQRSALPTGSVKDAIESRVLPANQAKRTHTQAFIEPNGVAARPSKNAKRNFGSSREQFRSITQLTSTFGKEFFPFNKPLMFLRNENSTVFLLAKSYLEEWKYEYNARIYHNQKEPRSIDLVACYIHPISGKQVDLGPIEHHFLGDGKKSHMASLLSLPGGDSRDIYDERDLTTLAQSMFCFDKGVLVDKSPEMAQSLAKSLCDEGISAGIHMAMHHATASNDQEEALYFLSKGGNPRAIWDGNHEHALDMAIRNENVHLASAFLSTFKEKDIAYLQYLLGNRDYESGKMITMVEARIKTLAATPES